MHDPTPSAEPWIAIASEQLTARIDPHGAQLSELTTADRRALLWNGDPTYWSGRAPLLFPIVGALNQGAYRIDHREYALPRHGFARTRLFTVVESGPSAALFRLCEDEETRAVYPFRFELTVRFELAAATLSITATVRNPGDVPLWASLGFHPAFRWPLPFGDTREAHRLRFDRPEPARIRRLGPDGLLRRDSLATPVIGDTLSLADHLFRDDVLILDDVHSRSLRFGGDTGRGVRIAYPDARYLGIWTKPGAPFICIEPWHGIADPEGFTGDFSQKPGVFTVVPGDSFATRMHISLE